MTRNEILKAKAIGYWSELGGVEIKSIDESGLDESLTCVSNAWYGEPQAHKLKIYRTKKHGVPYINLHGVRLSFDDCLRCN